MPSVQDGPRSAQFAPLTLRGTLPLADVANAGISPAMAAALAACAQRILRRLGDPVQRRASGGGRSAAGDGGTGADDGDTDHAIGAMAGLYAHL